MASGLTDVASKHAAIKARKDELAVTDGQVDDLMGGGGADEMPPSKGACQSSASVPSAGFQRARASPRARWPPSRLRGLRRPSSRAAKAIACSIGSSGSARNRRARRRRSTPQWQRFRRAWIRCRTVKLARERALALRRPGSSGRRCELKIKRHREAARRAHGPGHIGDNMIAESTLQRELATALKSTTEGVKKVQGPLTLAETALTMRPRRATTSKTLRPCLRACSRHTATVTTTSSWRS